MKFTFAASLVLALTACGGGGGGSTPPAPPVTYNISGNVNGSPAPGLALQLNGGSTMPVNAQGFAWTNGLVNGQTFTVTVSTQPAGWNCTVSNGTGTVTGNNVSNVQVNCNPTVAQTLSLFAGNMGGQGNSDGVGTNARFFSPLGIATDNAGNIYVTDVENAQTIRKITPAGVVSTFAGTRGTMGSADGTGSAASFFAPEGIATDGAGNVYVADTGNNTIRKITPTGVVTTWAGAAGAVGNADGTGSAAGFNHPNGLASDSVGDIYVADTGNNTIRKITPTGVVTTLAGTAGVTGHADGTGNTASFYAPQGIATDSAGNLYVADSSNATIRKITPAGVVTTLAGSVGGGAGVDGTGAAARFGYPAGISTDSAGNLYVTDSANATIRKVTPVGVVTTLAGTQGVVGSSDGTGAAAQFSLGYFSGVATDSAGNIYVADSGNYAIREVTSTGVVTTLAGAPAVTGSVDAIGANARFDGPLGLTADHAGNIYVADFYNYTIRKITPGAAVSTFAGLAGSTGNVDGTGSAARFGEIFGNYPGALPPRGPAVVATDSVGNVYVVDDGNFNIRLISPGATVTTLAGPGATGPLASVVLTATSSNLPPDVPQTPNSPGGIVIDSLGNVYVANTGNHVINKITPSGVFSVFAGSSLNNSSVDGVGTAANFCSPVGITIDSSDNLYVSDCITVRKITSAGAVTTLAGNPSTYGSADGLGAAASFGVLNGITIDSLNNLYVADTGHNTIRKITSSGAVTTFVGVAGQQGFLPGALPGVLSGPTSVVVSGNSLYISSANGVAVVNDIP